MGEKEVIENLLNIYDRNKSAEFYQKSKVRYITTCLFDGTGLLFWSLLKHGYWLNNFVNGTKICNKLFKLYEI